MALADPHDARKFLHFAKLGTDGSVVAIIEVSEREVEAFLDASDQLLVDVTDLHPYDFGTTKADVRSAPAKPADTASDAAKKAYRQQKDAVTLAAKTVLTTGNRVPRPQVSRG